MTTYDTVHTYNFDPYHYYTFNIRSKRSSYPHGRVFRTTYYIIPTVRHQSPPNKIIVFVSFSVCEFIEMCSDRF